MENKIQTGIWIDGSKAVIITFSDGEKNISEIKSGAENRVYHQNEGGKGTFMGSHHLNHEKTFDQRKKNQTDKFIKEVVNNIAGSDEVYVFGPGETKIVLKKKIADDYKNNPGKLMGVDTADYITINQMVEKTKQFYNLIPDDNGTNI